jgi:nodulation protein E
MPGLGGIGGARRLAVTGAGAVSALGPSVRDNWLAARDGRCAIREQTVDPGEHGPPPHVLPLASVAPGYTAGLDAYLKRPATGLDPFAALATAAAFEALGASGLLDAPVLHERTAIVLGHGMGGLATLEACYERFFGRRTPRLHPATVPRAMVSAGVSAVAMAFGVHGPVFATSSACASSAHAIAQGAALVASGCVDVAIVGGSEAIATGACLRAWEATHALSRTGCRPFSADRDGTVLGEGAGVLILEEREHALRRGAALRGELIGVGMTSDAFHLTQPSPEGPLAAMTTACPDAELLAEGSVLVAAHGTGTALNDRNEAGALRRLFGARAASHPVIATKGTHGHIIGGSAALQVVIGLEALAKGLAPPICGFTARDPECDLDLVLGEARAIGCEQLLVNAFGFGGLNVSLRFTGPDASGPGRQRELF